MRPFLTRILICTIPCLIAAFVVGRAWHRYQNGEGGFKLGVDLVGGTILVYEIDKDRQVGGSEVADETRKSQRLAEALKRRIDPADLYNVTIRPMGEDRVEIILPSGSVRAQTAEEERFQNLLEEVRENQEWKDDLDGYTFQSTRTSVRELPLEVQRVVNEKRWARAIEALVGKYPALQPRKDKLEKVGPDDLDALLKVVQEAAPPPPAGQALPTPDQVKSFLADAYKPADLLAVSEFIEAHYPTGRDRKNLGSGDVQHIKNLISQQGSLEFSILANSEDDKAALEAARA